MGKINVKIKPLADGNYSGESHFCHDTGLAAVAGGHTLISVMNKNGDIIYFTIDTWKGKRSLLLPNNDLVEYVSKTEKMHYNAHKKALHEFLNPEIIEQPIYSKFIFEDGRNIEIVDARRVKNSLEIKGKYSTYINRSGRWIEATDYKIKFYEKYIELKNELNKIKESLFTEGNKDVN